MIQFIETREKCQRRNHCKRDSSDISLCIGLTCIRASILLSALGTQTHSTTNGERQPRTRINCERGLCTFGGFWRISSRSESGRGDFPFDFPGRARSCESAMVDNQIQCCGIGNAMGMEVFAMLSWTAQTRSCADFRPRSTGPTWRLEIQRVDYLRGRSAWQGVSSVEAVYRR